MILRFSGFFLTVFVREKRGRQLPEVWSVEPILSSFPIRSSTICSLFSFFYRAMQCIRGTSHGSVSVCVCVCLCLCLSVTSRCSTKTAKRRITKTTPHDTPGSLVFWRQRSPRNSTGVTPYEGAKCRWCGSKSVTFDKYLAISRKR